MTNTEPTIAPAIPLTDEQVKNWRRVLSTLIGPYALIMPVDEVQKMRDRLQDSLNKDEDTDLTSAV